MQLRRIKINNFKSIYNTLELDFDSIRGFWRINGPVGAGKTTIGEAIIYGLFGDIHGKNNKELISWGESHSLIEVWCNSKGHELYIRREINMSGSSPIYAEIDGSELVFTNKRNAQQQLEEDYYDISRVTLELLCIISFNNFKSLATLNTSDTKQFLDQVFGFYILTNYVNDCKTERSTTRELQQLKQSDIKSISSQIDKIKQLANVARIEGNINDVSEKLNTLNKQLKEKLSDIAAFNADRSSEIDKITRKLAEVKALGANKAKEIKFIEQGTCPTCGAPIDQSQLELKKKERELLLEQYNSTNKELIDKKKCLSDDLTSKNNEVTLIRTEITELQQQKTRLLEQEKRLKINTKEIDSLTEQLKKNNAELDELNKDDQEWSMLIDILSSDIRNKILSSFIPLLNNAIREYTIQLQLPYIIVFDENFKCSISLYGVEQNVPISSLSTGQLKVVDICIILGVLKVITSNSNFNVCLLDELLSNMDVELRQLVCKVLKENIKDNQTIFIISHTEFEDKNFDGIINVELKLRDSIYKESNFTITKLMTYL